MCLASSAVLFDLHSVTFKGKRWGGERDTEREKLGQQTKMDSVETSDCNV